MNEFANWPDEAYNQVKPIVDKLKTRRQLIEYRDKHNPTELHHHYAQYKLNLLDLERNRTLLFISALVSVLSTVIALVSVFFAFDSARSAAIQAKVSLQQLQLQQETMHSIAAPATPAKETEQGAAANP